MVPSIPGLVPDYSSKKIPNRLEGSNVPIFQGSKNSASLEPSNAKTLDVSSLETLELSNLNFQSCNLNRGTHGVSRIFPKLQGSKGSKTSRGPTLPRIPAFHIPRGLFRFFSWLDQKKTMRYIPVEKTVALYGKYWEGIQRFQAFRVACQGPAPHHSSISVPRFQSRSVPWFQGYSGSSFQGSRVIGLQDFQRSSVPAFGFCSRTAHQSQSQRLKPNNHTAVENIQF